MIYQKGSLLIAVTATLSPLDSTDVEVVGISSVLHETVMESKASQDDDIDALLSAAGTFVSDQKTFPSSIIGPHSAVCAGPPLIPRNVDILSQSQQELPVSVTSDAYASSSGTEYSGHHHTAAAVANSSKSLASCVIAVLADSSVSTGRSKAVRCWLLF